MRCGTQVSGLWAPPSGALLFSSKLHCVNVAWLGEDHLTSRGFPELVLVDPHPMRGVGSLSRGEQGCLQWGDDHDLQAHGHLNNTLILQANYNYCTFSRRWDLAGLCS